MLRWFKQLIGASVEEVSTESGNEVANVVEIEIENEVNAVQDEAEIEEPHLPVEVLMPPELEISDIQALAGLVSFINSLENDMRIILSIGATALSTGVNFAIPWFFEQTTTALSSYDKEITIEGVKFSMFTMIGLLIAAYSHAQIIPNLRYLLLAPVPVKAEHKIMSEINNYTLQHALDTHSHFELSKFQELRRKGTSASGVVGPILSQIAPVLLETTLASSILFVYYGLIMGGAVFTMTAMAAAYGGITANPVLTAQKNEARIRQEVNARTDEELIRYHTESDESGLESSTQRIEEEQNRWETAKLDAVNKPLRMTSGYFIAIRLCMLLAIMYAGLQVAAQQFSILDFVILTIYLNVLSNALPAFGQAFTSVFAAWPDLKAVVDELTRPHALRVTVVDVPEPDLPVHSLSSPARMLSALGPRVGAPPLDIPEPESLLSFLGSATASSSGVTVDDAQDTIELSTRSRFLDSADKPFN